jgi:glycosyltransferase involved in cell wall biosynthesis
MTNHLSTAASDPSISVVVPVHNGGIKFLRALHCLSLCQPPPAEVIVVADGNLNADRQAAEKSGAMVLSTPNPIGPAGARNLGAQTAKGDILFFIDADVTVPTDAIRQIAACFKNSTEVTATFGSYDDSPFERNFLSQYKNLFHHYVHQSANSEASTFWTGCGAVRREIFLKMGGFNEAYRRPCIEDIELGYRLRRAGYRIKLLKNLKVTHLKRWGILSLLEADFFSRALPWTDLILGEGRFINDLNVNFKSRFSVGLTYLLILTLLSSLWFPFAVIASICLMAGLFALNYDLYSFFKEKRGVIFAAKTVFWHWLYFFYCGLAYAIGLTKHRVRNVRSKLNPDANQANVNR